jgi:hypothetical protein
MVDFAYVHLRTAAVVSTGNNPKQNSEQAQFDYKCELWDALASALRLSKVRSPLSCNDFDMEDEDEDDEDDKDQQERKDAQ